MRFGKNRNEQQLCSDLNSKYTNCDIYLKGAGLTWNERMLYILVGVELFLSETRRSASAAQNPAEKNPNKTKRPTVA